MLKRILPDELELGMFIESAVFEEQPGIESTVGFLRNILVDTPEKLERYSKGRLKFLIIDTKKSVTIQPPEPPREPVQAAPPPEPPQAKAPEPEPVREPVIEVKAPPKPPEPQPEPEVEEPEPEPEPDNLQPAVPFHEELENAKIVREEAKAVVSDFMNDARLGKALDSTPVKEQASKLVDSLFRNPDALTSLTRLKGFDNYTFTHCVNVTVLVTSFSKRLGFNRNRLERLATGGLLHDVGKMKIPDKILNKPGRFTPEERKIVQDHPVFSYEILQGTEGIHPDSLRVALEHHERLDGGGYPHGKTEFELHIDTNIISICDVYDALSSKRVYKPAMPLPQCLAYLLERSDSEFKRNLVETFIKVVGVYPVGSLLELSGGEIGIVVEINRDNIAQPWILVVMNNRKQLLKKPERICIGDFSAAGRRIMRFLDPEKVGIDPNKWLPTAPEGIV